MALQGKVTSERTSYISHITLSLSVPTSLKTPTLQYERDMKLDRPSRQPRREVGFYRLRKRQAARDRGGERAAALARILRLGEKGGWYVDL